MPPEITVTIQAVWKWQEASENKCFCCGDPIFLREKRLFIRTVGSDVIPEEETNLALCQSCGEAHGK